MDSTKISALLIVLNEERNIAEVLNSVKFADEIIVVDSYSKDKTEEIVKHYFPEVKFLKKHFENFSKQRNFAIQHAKNEWILFIDADERISPELRQEILREIRKTDAKDAYFFRRKFFYKNKPIHFSGTQNDKNIRLFRKKHAHYGEQSVHETLENIENIGVLENKMDHYSFENYHEYHEKVLHYAKLKALDLNKKQKHFHYSIQFGKTFFNFFKTYFLKLGILDGRKGVVLSYLSALTAYKTYEFLHQLNEPSIS